MSRLRSRIPLLAFTPYPRTRRQLALSWGVQSLVTPSVTNTDEMVDTVDCELRDRGYAQLGDRVVVVAGAPVGRPGTTNFLQVHTIGHDDAARASD